MRAAIARAVRFLYSKQDRQGYFPTPHSREYIGGGDALVILALLRAGVSPREGRLRRALAFLKTVQPGHTYTGALRAMVYASLSGREWLHRLNVDAQWLIRQQRRNGGWGYGPRSFMTRRWPEWTDGSNTQFAVLALRDAADAGVAVSPQVFRRAEGFWRSFQNRDGGWGYQPRVGRRPPQRPESHGSMTAAAVASYFIFADVLAGQVEPAYQLFQPRRPRPGRLFFARRIERGLKWLDANYRVDKVPKFIWTRQPSQLYYYLFCLQRAGDGAGLWTFAGRDYCADIARLLLGTQRPNGSWNDSVIDTAFAILTLEKAAAPVAVNRLLLPKEHEPYPRDAANLVRWLGRRLGRTLAWRAVRADQAHWLRRSRLLYLHLQGQGGIPAGAEASLVKYVRNGGTVLVQAPAPQAVAAIVKFFKRLFPDYAARKLSGDHPVFNLRFAVEQKYRPDITGIGDGCRERIFVLAQDVGGAWHQGRWREYPQLFGLGGNIVLYACGGQDPPGKFAMGEPDGEPPPAVRYITVARVKYAGDYDVCPLAVAKLSRRLRHSLPVGLKSLPPVAPTEAAGSGATVLWLTGNVPPKFSDAEKQGLREYLAAGGTLLIDPAIGRADFRSAALQLLKELCGSSNVAPLKADHPLLTGRFAGGVGADLRKLAPPAPAATRPATQPAPARLWGGTVNGRLAAVLSHYGLTCSIEGTPCVGNVGYVPADARKIALNVILYAASRHHAVGR